MRILVALFIGVVGFAMVQSLSGAVEAAPPGPWVGHWTAIHASPAIPYAQMNITQHGGDAYKLRIDDQQDFLFCAGDAARARGEGQLTDATHMTVEFHFRCDSGAEGDSTVPLILNLGNPHGILEIADSSGHVWTRLP